jgi:GMP synthase (glutamine-hydrolysing)
VTPAVAGGQPESPVLVFEHQPDAPAGLVGEWLSDRAIPCRTVRQEDPTPDPTAAGALVSLGSSHSAYASAPAWIPRHVELLRDALTAGTPVLGICFGAQALAVAAGGTVARAQRPEVGWVAPVSEQPVLGGPWLAWHFDAIAAPADAVELAWSADALQAYAVGASLGLQFHPEVTPEIWEDWASREPEVHRRHAGEPAELAAEVAAAAGPLRSRVYALLDWWWARPALVCPIDH